MPGPSNRNDPLNNIKHVVVIYLENRSFDHMLGYRSLPRSGGPPFDPTMDGLKGTESNPRPDGTRASVHRLPGTRFPIDPRHGHGSTPWVRRKSVSKVVFDNTAILRTILELFCEPGDLALSPRIEKATGLGVLLSEHKARTDFTRAPAVPLPSRADERSLEDATENEILAEIEEARERALRDTVSEDEL